MLRRNFLKAVGVAAIAAVRPGGLAAIEMPLVLWAARAGDEAQIDCATLQGQQTLAWLLRDIRAGNLTGIPHPGLVKLLCWQQAWLAAYGFHVRFDILSGLRSGATNRSTEGAARNSLHQPDAANLFRAVDFHSATVNSEYLGRLAALAQQGGVGFYDGPGFVHVDVGRSRYWRH